MIKLMQLAVHSILNQEFIRYLQYSISFMMVVDIEKLYDYVKNNNWDAISDITLQSWGGKECSVTTIDGGIIRFFQIRLIT